MKAINFKLATFTFAAMLLASCSDSNNDGSTTTGMNNSIVGSEVTSSTDAQELASRVYNFQSKTRATKTRTIDETNSSLFEGITDMPAAPTSIPADAKNIKEYTDWNLPQGTYYVAKGETVECNHPYAGTTVYVAGTFIQNGMNADENTKIYILPGGKWKTNGRELVNGNATIYNYGTLEATNNYFEIKGTYLTNGDLNFPGDELNIQGKVYVGGNLTAKKMTNSGMKLNVKGNCDLGTSDFILNGDGSTQYYDNPNKVAMNIDGTFTAGSVQFNSSAKFYSGCAVKVARELNINSNSIVSVSYLKAKSIKQSSGTSFILKDQSLIECDVYDDQNAGSEATSDAQNAGSVLLGDNATAVVKANKFIFNTGGPLENGTEKYDCFMFRTNSTSKIILDGKYYRKNGENYIEILPYFPGARIFWASDKGNSSDVVIRPTECNGQSGWNPTDPTPTPAPDPDPDPTPKEPIVPISVIESDHTHDISATCVQPYSDKMYMSYHTRGEGHGSCIEVFQPVDANKEVKLLQYVYDKNGYVDWNHLMVYHKNNVKQVYVVGNHYKKAGVMGYIDITNGGLLNTDPKTIVTEDGENKTIQPLNLLALDANKPKTDENCIVYDDSQNPRFIVMTTDGYVTYDPETLNEIEKVSKPGKAKHVTIGDGKVVTLVFTEQAKTKDDPTEAIKAQIEVRDRNATMASEPKLTISDIPAVMPHYGKNTIVAKNSKIYACLGAAGLYCYDANTGAELGHYQMPSPIIKDSKEGKVGNYKAYANGCYVGDDGKVYIAYGSYGVVVLKAGTLEAGAPETIAHVCEGKSANYITVYKDYIYVAYGQKRLQVYQLVEDAQ